MAKVSERPGPTPRIGASILTVLFLAFGVWYLVTTFFSESTATPYVAGCAVVFAILVAWELTSQMVGFRRRGIPRAGARTSDAGSDVTDRPDPIRWRIFVPALALMAGFAYVATQVDYIVGTAVFTALTIMLLGKRRVPWWVSVVTAVCAVVAVHLIFVVLLKASLPSIIGIL
jgi:hypothetical protein